MMEKEHIDQKKTWGYSESFLIAFELLVLGFAIEIVTGGGGVRSPRFPFNLYILFAYLIVIVFLHSYFRKMTIIKWLSSVPCSISAISTYALLVLLLGFIPQDRPMARIFNVLGLNHVKNSWPFLVIEIYVLTSLGLVILRRAYPFTRRNLGFLLNHFGLWITLIAAGLGSGDLKRLSLELFEKGDYQSLAVDARRQIFGLPFSMKLLDFKMEVYNPKIALADSRKGEIIRQHGESLPLIEKGKEVRLKDWKIRITELIAYALKSDSGYYPSSEPGTAAAAYIIGTNTSTSDSIRGWLCSGSMRMDPAYIYLKNSQVLFITAPEPKKFESILAVRNKKDKTDTIKLEVNKPHKIEGWKLYQMSYDQTMGRDSQLSVIEAVHDPWLPIVYAGIMLLLSGGVYIFWRGGEIRMQTDENS